jgi:hypothetical protein
VAEAGADAETGTEADARAGRVLLIWWLHVCRLPNMTWTVSRLASSMGLALCLGFVFTPLGCGGGREMRIKPVHRGGAGPTLPEDTVARLTECANQGAARLTESSYTIVFDVEAREDGHVKEARVKDSFPGAPDIESCMAHALGGMSLPASIMRKAGRVSPESRREMPPLGCWSRWARSSSWPLGSRSS